MMRNILSLSILTILLCSCGGGNREQVQCNGAGYNCQTKEECLNDPDCLCWCSQVCNWRKKTAKDHPVYIENDPYGKYCYCKQWDYDYYEDNCILHKGVKQPKNAQ